MLSWLIIAIIVVGLMLPVYSALADAYPYYLFNIVSIFVFLYFTKHIFLLRHSLFAYLGKIKFVLVVLCIPLFLYFLDGMYETQRFFDEERLYSIISRLPGEEQFSLSRYIRYITTFFSTAAIIVTVIFPIRLIVSSWRTRNRGTV